MRKEATLQEWKRLYEIALKLKEIKPWEYFWDIDLITLALPDLDEPCFCSVMGRGGACTGIGFYFGYDSINGFMNIVENEGIPGPQLIRYQNCQVAYFGDRQELEKQDYNIIKELGYHFRGRNQWLYFRSYKVPYAPYLLDRDEVKMLTKAFDQLYEAVCEYIEKEIKVDFESQETLLHSYENNCWTTKAAPLKIPAQSLPRLVLKDDLLMLKLKKRPKTRAVLEMDILYCIISLVHEAFDRPLLPRIAAMADSGSGLMLEHTLLDPDDSPDITLANLLIDFILNNGRPEAVYMRDVFCAAALKDLCDRLGVPLLITPMLETIDFYSASLSEYDL